MKLPNGWGESRTDTGWCGTEPKVYLELSGIFPEKRGKFFSVDQFAVKRGPFLTIEEAFASIGISVGEEGT